MKRFVKIIMMVLVLTSFTSCKKYLDVTPDNVGTLEYAFRNRNEAENYLFSCYAYLQRLSDVARNPGFTTSSELIYPNNLTDFLNFNRTGFNLITGTQNAASPGLNVWVGDGDNEISCLFRSIRICNIMLENIDKPVDLSQSEKTRWIGEVKFLKAYYHYYLFRMYGPIPITDVNLPITSTPEEVRVKRDAVDDVVNYIVKLLNEAAEALPVRIDNQARDLGRVTQPIALAVKAEVLMTAASPLFNGNPDYASFTDKGGKALFPQTYDAQKWVAAADACREAIAACEAQGMSLYQFVPPATISNMNDDIKRVLTIQNAVTERWDLNPEMIWAQNPYFSYQGHASVRLTSRSVVNAFSNPSTFSAPISTQELFYTSNGVPMNEDKNWNYANRYHLKMATQADKNYLRPNYETVEAHFGREPRFYANLAFDGAAWFGNGKMDANDMYTVQARGNSALAGPKDRIRLNITGYWPKKLVHYLSVYDDGFQPIHFRMPLMRLAGLYLLYAEALNEVNGPNATVYQYIDKVRTRAGLPGVQAAWTNSSRNPAKPNSKDGLREIIHRERRIELCFEAQAGWDLRRWKELQQVLSVPLLGWNIYQAEASNYYQQQIQLLPVFRLRDYLWPIKANNLIINPNLVQNPYW